MGGERGECVCVSVGERGVGGRRRAVLRILPDVWSELRVYNIREEVSLFLTSLKRELTCEPERNDIAIA